MINKNTMKIKTYLFGLLITIATCLMTSCKETNPKSKSFDYFKQTSPGDSAELFAHGIISDETTKEADLAISPNGDEIFFVRGTWPNTKIMYMSKSSDKWSLPDTAKFSTDCWATEPAFSPDGKFLYFSTSKGKTGIMNYNLWRIEKAGNTWTEPESLFDLGGDSIWEFHPAVTMDGSVYFCAWNSLKEKGDIYVSHCTEKGCSEPDKIESPISTEFSEGDPYVEPNGTYMIFNSNRPGGYGGEDQYITFKNNDGSWTNPENLGTKYNSEKDDYDMDISPDGKYIFLYLNGDIYWMQVGDLKDNKTQKGR